MFSRGLALTLSMAAFSALTIAGMSSGDDSIRWTGTAGMGIGAVCLIVLVKDDERRQRLGIKRNPRVWCTEAVFTPPWVMWIVRVMLFALVVEAQILLNDLAGIG